MEKVEKISLLVSVIIPFYNSEKTIEKCLKSVLNQTYEELEIILVDNGSSDNGRKLVEKYALSDPRIHITESIGVGVSRARNTGIAKANGKYIQFIDSDDYVETDYVHRLVQEIEKRENALVICDYFQFDDQTEDMRCDSPLVGSYSIKKFLRKLARNPGAHYFGVLWNKIYIASIIKENQVTFPENISLGEDFIFNMEYFKHIEEVVCISDKLYHYWWKRKGSLCSVHRKEEEVVEERLLLYQEYEKLFRYEKLYSRYKSAIQYFYIVRFYFNELELLGDDAGEYKDWLYQKCIAGTGIGKIKFGVFYAVKKGVKAGKSMMKIH